MSYEIKDSGARTEYSSGMMRDKADDKIEFWSMRIGPMFQRWAQLLTNGRKKYPDTAPGVPNWTLAAGEAELLHAKASLTRHFEQYLAGDTDEDHAAAVFFNINLMEYIKEKMAFEEQTGADAEVFTEETWRTYTGVDTQPASRYVGWLDENGDAQGGADSDVFTYDLKKQFGNVKVTGEPFLDVLKGELDRVAKGVVTGLDENDDALPPVPAEMVYLKTPEDQLRLREYRDRMRREQTILQTPIGTYHNIDP